MVVLTQAQNEAIVKLMLLARYQDKELSLTEEAQFNQYLNELNWQAVTAVDTYAMRETTAVRKALDNAGLPSIYGATKPSLRFTRCKKCCAGDGRTFTVF